MAPNSNDEATAHESGPNTTGGKFEHENSGDFGRSDYVCRGDYGTGARHFYDKRDPFEMEEVERRGYMGEGERRTSVVDLRMDFEGEGPYGSYRGFYGSHHFGPMDSHYSHGGYGREDYYGHGYEGPFIRHGHARDHSPHRRDRFDSGPFGRHGYGTSFERHGYGGARVGHGYGSDYGRSHYYDSDYARSRYGHYGRGFGDSYGSHGYGYRGEYGSPSYGGNRPYGYGGMYGREYQRYGYGGDYERFGGSDYDRFGYAGSQGGIYGHGGQYARRDYRGYGGMYNRYGDFGYGRYSRDHSPYGFSRTGYERHSSPHSYSSHDYSRPGRGYYGRYDQSSGHYGYRRAPYDHFSSSSHTPYGYSSSGTNQHPFGHHGGMNQFGHERYQGPRISPFGGGYGQSPYERPLFDQDKLRIENGTRFGSNHSAGLHSHGHQHGHGVFQGHRGNQFWSGGRQCGGFDGNNHGCRSGPFDDREPNGRRPMDHGYRWGGSNPSLDKCEAPPPFPPFNQSRSHCPSSYSNF